MMIRQTPTNIENFVKVNSELSEKLHELGFIPRYIDNEWIYYEKTKEIENILERSK